VETKVSNTKYFSLYIANVFSNFEGWDVFCEPRQGYCQYCFLWLLSGKKGEKIKEKMGVEN